MPALTGFVPTTGTVFETHAPATGGGTVDYSGAPGANSWTPVANVIDIKKLPAVGYEKIEKTLLVDTVKRYAAGQGDPSEFEFECNYDTATYAALVILLAVDKAFRIKCIDSTGIGWSGFINMVELKPQKGKNNLISVKGQASGAVSTIASD